MLISLCLALRNLEQRYAYTDYLMCMGFNEVEKIDQSVNFLTMVT